jgi:hypothetical protein
MPEQYDVFINGEEVGMVHVRRGILSVEVNGREIYNTPIQGDGEFRQYERGKFLGIIQSIILENIMEDIPNANTSETPEMPKMSIEEFRKSGYLREVNRQFFYPLGLALEVVVNDDGTETLGGIWDYRSDPEGMFFADGVLDDIAEEQFKKIDADREEKAKVRISKYGCDVQPFNKNIFNDQE